MCLIKKYLCIFGNPDDEKAKYTFDLTMCHLTLENDIIFLESEI